eukprot:TRINITY_DN45075_c0_g1_i1.p1 TRINITY_DN45075_c0_g1~~TRINITY_DN45075_c0_g1_i1.p1  ORF type:complete len:452 (+),score=66.25 TRINITY_DN45075_c0_g1_i1:43-1398(+)
MFMIVLCDSLLCAHKCWGIKLHTLHDGDERFHCCLCIASGGSLIMSGGVHCEDSAVGLCLQALNGEPAVRGHVFRDVDDPTVHVIVLNAENSTSKCRDKGEQYPLVVADRKQSSLVKRLETPWTICDLEDVVQQRHDRTFFPELEACKLRSFQGIYGQKGDDIHFRKDVAIAAGDELLKGIRRTSMARYSDVSKPGDVLLVLAAGWNTNGTQFRRVDKLGHAWRKAELVTLAELSALNGHPLSSFTSKMIELVHASKRDHNHFLGTLVGNIRALSPPEIVGPKRKRYDGRASSSTSHLDEWVQGHRVNTGVRDTSGSDETFRRDAQFLAEVTNLPIDTAESVLRRVGEVSVALELPMFQETASLNATMVSSACRSKVIHVIDDEEAEIHSEWRVSGNELQQLLQMGFPELQARTALQRSDGNVSRAIDFLVCEREEDGQHQYKHRWLRHHR